MELVEKVKNLFVRLGIDASCPFSSEELIYAMMSDKKADNKKISLIVLPRLGEAKVLDIEFEKLREIL
jgi:3-dehydroquinate synthetase